jgi:hypothetical protein
MTRKQRGLSPADHVELGQTLKRARNLLLEAGAMCRPYGQLAQDLFDLADRGLMSPRAFLEKRLIEQVGSEDATVEGVRVRDVYFGPLVEQVDA